MKLTHKLGGALALAAIAIALLFGVPPPSCPTYPDCEGQTVTAR